MNLVRLAWRSGRWIQKKREDGKTVRGDHCLKKVRDFPRGPVVKTSPSNAGGCRFDPWLGS